MISPPLQVDTFIIFSKRHYTYINPQELLGISEVISNHILNLNAYRGVKIRTRNTSREQNFQNIRENG